MNTVDVLSKYNLPADNRIVAVRMLRELIQGDSNPLGKAQEIIADFQVEVSEEVSSDATRARLAAAAIIEFAIKANSEAKPFDPKAAGQFVVERQEGMAKSFPSAFIEGKTTEKEMKMTATQTSTAAKKATTKNAPKTKNAAGKRGPKGDIIEKITTIYQANKGKELAEIAKIVMDKVKMANGEPMQRANVYSRLYTVRQRLGETIAPKGKPAGRKAAGRKPAGRKPAKRSRKK